MSISIMDSPFNFPSAALPEQPSSELCPIPALDWRVVEDTVVQRLAVEGFTSQEPSSGEDQRVLDIKLREQRRRTLMELSRQAEEEVQQSVRAWKMQDRMTEVPDGPPIPTYPVVQSTPSPVGTAAVTLLRSTSEDNWTHLDSRDTVCPIEPHDWKRVFQAQAEKAQSARETDLGAQIRGVDLVAAATAVAANDADDADSDTDDVVAHLPHLHQHLQFSGVPPNYAADGSSFTFQCAPSDTAVMPHSSSIASSTSQTTLSSTSSLPRVSSCSINSSDLADIHDGHLSPYTVADGFASPVVSVEFSAPNTCAALPSPSPSAGLIPSKSAPLSSQKPTGRLPQ